MKSAGLGATRSQSRMAWVAFMCMANMEEQSQAQEAQPWPSIATDQRLVHAKQAAQC
jgi:hypothetical protein